MSEMGSGRGRPPPFVGREAEVAVLDEVLARPGVGHGGLVLVTGGAGIGKSRLVAVCVDRLTGAGAEGTAPRVGYGECLSDLLMPPLWPLRRAVSSAAIQAGEEPGSALGRVSALLTPPDPASGPPAYSAAPGWDRLAVLGEIVDRLVAAAYEVPLVLVVEDVHWADTETLALLRLLAPELRRTPLAVLLTARPVEDDDRALALAALVGSPAAQVVALRPLSVADVEEYLARGGHGGDPASVHAVSGGLPLLLPVAVGSPDSGSDRRDVDVPTLVRRLTVSLPEQHVRILEAASLVTVPLDAELAAAAAGVGIGAAADATAAALRAGLLVPAPDGAGGLAFAHELVRSTLAGRLTGDRARAAHRRIALLGAARTGVPAVRIASHWEGAGPGAEAAAHAARWWARAAVEASGLRAHSDAATHQARAAVAAAAAGWPDAEVAGHHLVAAQAWHRAGRYDRAVTAAEHAAALAEAAGRPDLVAQAALAVGWVAYPEAQVAVGRLTRAALARQAELDEATRARLVAQQVASLGNYAPARGGDLAAEAMRLGRRSGDPTALLEAIGAWMAARPEIGGAEEQRLLAEEALRAAARTDQPVPTVMAHTWRLNSVVRLGEMETAREELESLRLIAERSRLPLATWHWLRASVALAVLRGDVAVVEDHHARATAIARDSGDVVAANVGHAAVFEMATRRGVPLDDPEETLALFARVPSSTLIDAPKALLLDQIGRTDEARAIYQRLAPLVGAAPEYRPWWPLLYLLLQLAERFDDTAVGQRLVAELEPYARNAVGGLGTSTVWFIGHPGRQVGRALALAGRPDEAVTAFRGAMTVDERLGARPDVALGRLAVAQVLARDSRAGVEGRDARRTALDEARLAARECRGLDMPGHMVRAEALVAQLTAALTASDPLSPREREVTALVEDGLSNHAIAERLFLSERTVESHVRAALTKLGCRNRAELIRLRLDPGPPPPA